MKVVIYAGELPSTTFVERLINGLAVDGIQVVVSGKRVGNHKYHSHNVEVIEHPRGVSRIWSGISYFLLFAFCRPHKLQDLIGSYPGNKFSKLFLIWFQKVAPILWSKPDIFHLQWTKELSKWMFLQKHGIKLIASLRGAHINYSPIADEELAASYRESFPKVDAFHGVSRTICFEAKKYAADLEKCFVVYSGLDLREFPFQSSKRCSRERVNIISVGRPHWKKAYHFALDAMNELKKRGVYFHYTIVGGWSEEILFQLHDLNLTEDVSIEENIPFEDVKTKIAGADFLLLSSVEEGIPNVVLEAMALGTIVISTDCGGIREVIEDKVNGFVVPIRDPEAIASTIEEIAKYSDSELTVVRKNARQTIERQHTMDLMVEQMKKLYSVVCQGDPGRLA